MTFVINLCALASPVAIRQPRSPEFNRYRFFVSRRRLNGLERFFLHMGYFSTDVEAQKWLTILRRTYPSAFVSQVSSKSPEAGSAAAPGLPRVGATAPAAAQLSQASKPSSVSLTDTQVLKVLETRRPGPDGRIDEIGYDETGSADISMLRPDDTDTRRALKEAVTRNEPVSFAVQLDWSPQPIELEKTQTLAIFKLYTLYTAQGNRDGRNGFCLRLGFFSDAISARQVAHYVRSEFASVAVVPIGPQERARAQKNATRSAPMQPLAETRSATRPPAPEARHSMNVGAKADTRERDAETLEETLEVLAASELEMDDDSLSATGVRHLRVQVQKKEARSLKGSSARTRK